MIKLSELLTGTTRDPFTGELYEGLIHTVDPEKAIEMLRKQKLHILQDIYTNSMGEVVLDLKPRYVNPAVANYFTGSTHDSELSTLLKLINNLGYFPAVLNYGEGYKPYNPSSFRNIIRDDQPSDIRMVLGAKYDQEVTLPKLVYHATRNANVESILKIGLKPSTKSKKANHPERVYIAFSEEGANLIAQQLHNSSSDPQSLLTLDTSKFPGNLKFYRDPHFLDGAYTLGNIPPNAITNISSYKNK